MRRLKGEDNSFLAWENDVQPQHTIKAVVLDPARGHTPITFERVKAAAQGMVDRIEPLQWQLLMPRLRFGRPWWISRPRLDIDYHVKRVAAAAPGGDRELAATISAIFEPRLDRGRPPWQLWYVDGLAGGRIALVLKIHHAVADGMASLHLLETMYSTDPQARLPEPAVTPLPNERRPAPWIWLPLVMRHQLAALFGFPRIIARTARVTRTIRRRQKAGKPGYAAAFAAPGARFNAPLTSDRRFAYQRCDMQTIKQVTKTLGVTVNDVFLACCSGALREFLDRHAELPAETLTAVVPVSMRPPGAEIGWGNHVARWNVLLATNIADPVERLTAIAAATRTAREVQAERDALLQHDWMEYWPLFWFYSRALPLVGERMSHRPTFSLIASNMRGPQRRLYWGGAPIEQLISTGPLVFPMGLNFTGWSYEDQMTIGVLTCGDHVADPWEIADGLPRALAELAERASVGVESVEQAEGKTAAGVDVLPEPSNRV
ncbi:wax ester/triacylglycerol synthase family O-acyltransferase [Mycobacterium branderi]|uniref:Diacylglycerol O-acyltransferase n=1 Tax=Mycobacterium branderi TaxID=43348 RepID=A0ABM7KLM3_9MYCO|nr:wax ester/triacylglycerol synthase family O-acyltransferase [Mycobacterium branderi]MCV7233956.1 wax ester/triacylglycerol synthase family O-acyltransferase [Mycobacterium branderi]BBZ11928.1 putative diacyglycerol O-acyltransferase [Mycobacterium branderi]